MRLDAVEEGAEVAGTGQRAFIQHIEDGSAMCPITFPNAASFAQKVPSAHKILGRTVLAYPLYGHKLDFLGKADF